MRGDNSDKNDQCVKPQAVADLLGVPTKVPGTSFAGALLR